MRIAHVEPGRTVEVVERELTYDEQNRIAAELAQQGLYVEPSTDIFGVVNLWALEPCSTADEVRVLRAFREVTDARLAWHGAGAS